MDTKIIDALLGENGNGDAILDAVAGSQAYAAARHVVEAIVDNEEANGPGTYATWTDGAHAVEVYGLGEEFAALTEEERTTALPLITAGVGRAIRILTDVGHLGDKAIEVADEIERLSDDGFREKALAAIEAQLSKELSSGRTVRFVDCEPNQGFEVEVNGMDFSYRYETPMDAISDAARDGYTDDEWDALDEDMRDEIENDVIVQTVVDEMEQGVVAEMFEQVDRVREGKLESAESWPSFIRYEHREQAA